ncbi:MAG: hypothetical protein MZW92_38240 [Comamonadaceae bacterium]|nr:hypothetical protein [Comamonadaceae bacterium]
MALVVFVFADRADARRGAPRRRWWRPAQPRQRRRASARAPADRGAERRRRASRRRSSRACPAGRRATRAAQPLVSKEPVVLISAAQARAAASPANARRRARHHGHRARRCGRRCSMVEGRMFRPGSDEIVAGRAVAERLRAASALGETLRFARPRLDGGRRVRRRQHRLRFARSGATPSSCMQAFRRPAYSRSLIFRLADAGAASTPCSARSRTTRALTLEVKRESAVLRRPVARRWRTSSAILGTDAVGDLLHRRRHRRR